MFVDSSAAACEQLSGHAEETPREGMHVHQGSISSFEVIAKTMDGRSVNVGPADLVRLVSDAVWGEGGGEDAAQHPSGSAEHPVGDSRCSRQASAQAFRELTISDLAFFLRRELFCGLEAGDEKTPSQSVKLFLHGDGADTDPLDPQLLGAH